jgi:hypothetical protein
MNFVLTMRRFILLIISDTKYHYISICAASDAVYVLPSNGDNALLVRVTEESFV